MKRADIHHSNANWTLEGEHWTLFSKDIVMSTAFIHHVQIVQCTVCIKNCVFCSVQYAVCSMQCAVCSVQCTVCSVQYTVYSVTAGKRGVEMTPNYSPGLHVITPHYDTPPFL